MAEEYSGMQLRRVPSMKGDRSRPQIGDEELFSYDQKLNSRLDFINNPYEKWRIKRTMV